MSDADFAYSGVESDTSKPAPPAPSLVETKWNGMDRAPYVAVIPNNAAMHVDKPTPVSVVSPNTQLAYSSHLAGPPMYVEKEKGYPDFVTSTVTTASSEGNAGVDRSDTTSVSSSSSAYIGELDGIGVRYVHPRGDASLEDDVRYGQQTYINQPDVSSHRASMDGHQSIPSQTSTVDIRPANSHESTLEMGEKRNPRRGDLYYSDIDVSTRL